MIFKHFKVQILLYLIVLVIGLFGLIYYSFIEVNFIRIFFLSLFCLITIIGLFYYINRTNRELRFFLNAVLHNDFSTKYAESNKGKTFRDLYATMSSINEKFNAISQQEASEYQYIVTLIAQMQIGVLIYDDKERVHLVNDAFKSIIQKKELIDLKGIKQANDALYEAIKTLGSQEKIILKAMINQAPQELSIAASEMKMQQRHYKIISIQDIKAELDANEMSAWQKLIRVLTHEIMNSVSPISSLSASLKALLHDPEKVTTVEEGLEAIESRSKNLLAFTEAYRKLTKVPNPTFEIIKASSYFERIVSLMDAQFAERDVHLKLEKATEDFDMQIDPVLLDQVLINLLKNAAEASAPDAHVTLSYVEEERTVIQIKDQGPGIPDDIVENIFIPFYTTKEEGSGIGLSLSRQIIEKMNGRLSFTTDQNGTCFKIEL